MPALGNRQGKRLLDLVLAWPAFLLLSPIIWLAAATVKLDSPGPAFFRQARVGQRGRLFRVIKLRTMQAGPPSRERRLTVSNDSRITRTGRWMRASKLDELPQLFNVIAGDMSLVGPRPEVPEWVQLYDHHQWEILRYKPGMTDVASIFYRDESALLAQADDPRVKYLNEIMPRKIKMSLAYLREGTMESDLKTILNTLMALFRK